MYVIQCPWRAATSRVISLAMKARSAESSAGPYFRFSSIWPGENSAMMPFDVQLALLGGVEQVEGQVGVDAAQPTPYTRCDGSCNGT